MDPWQRTADGILEDANAADSVDSFRRSMVGRLSGFIGLDSAAVHAMHPPPAGTAGGSVAVNLHPGLFDRFLREQPRYFQSAWPMLHALRTNGGLSIDTDVLGATARRRLAIYAEILVPAGVTSMLGSILTFRQAPAGILVLSRHGSRRGFRARDGERLRQLLPLLGTADAAVSARCSKGRSVALDRLGEREREVARLVARGLQNKEIAAILGTSVHTVRQQTRRIYEKLNVPGRVHLAAKCREWGDGQ
jgi:DNA-binding CsgD family transcriptional regulator